MDIWDYRQALKDHYAERRGRNAGYSLRAFARDLGLSAPRLNEILAGKKGLSGEAAKTVIASLGLSREESKLFLLSVNALHSRSGVARKEARRQLTEEMANLESEVERHSVVVHWSTEAAKKLLDREGFKADVENIASALNIPIYLATSPLRYLSRAGLIPQTKTQRAYIADRLKGKRLNVDYEQILELARKKFLASRLHSEERFEHAPLLIAPENLERARRIIRKAYLELKKLESKGRSARLFYFASQFFTPETERQKK